MEITEGVDLCL